MKTMPIINSLFCVFFLLGATKNVNAMELEDTSITESSYLIKIGTGLAEILIFVILSKLYSNYSTIITSNNTQNNLYSDQGANIGNNNNSLNTTKRIIAVRGFINYLVPKNK